MNLTSSDFTDEDVTAARKAMEAEWNTDRATRQESVAAALAAVLPDYRARVRAEVLRETITELEKVGLHHMLLDWLRARADAEGGNDE